MMESFREQALVFGARKSLVGILSLPAHAVAVADVPSVVILNAGVIHRVGPNRLHVGLARTLAGQGFPVLRFDLSGIGDSEKREDALPPAEAALADIRDALDHLDSTGRARGVVLAGLCSGANYALLSAAADPRVVGLILIDPYLPRTLGYYLRHFARRAIRLQSWLDFARGRHPLWRFIKDRLVRRTTSPAADQPLLSSREIHAVFDNAFRVAVERGVQFLGVFTAGREDQHNYREQLLDAYPGVSFGRLLRLEYFPHSDHTFSSGAERARLVQLIRDWTRSTAFRRPAAPGSAAPRRDTST